ncbi:MAG: YciI family protein [Desulfobacteraceae bacterium]
MTQFIIIYIGGDQPASPEEGQKHFAKYRQWLAALGSAAVSPMNPIKNTHTVHADGSVAQGGDMAMSGYTIVEAESLDEAISMAKACPFLEINGTLEVSELVKMGD